MRLILMACTVLLAPLFAFGCGTSSGIAGGVNQPYGEGSTVTITKDGSRAEPGDCPPSVASCAPDVCPDGKGPADVVVKDGKVVVAVCYPEPKNNGKKVVAPGDIKGVKSNGGVVTFDPDGDGKPYEDDLKVDGNQNTIYGNGADKTIIDGKATFKGNGNRARGVTVLGDVSFEGNNASIVLSVIEGDLTIKGNNAVVADVTVLGDLKIEGNNHVMMRVFVGGKVSVKGDNNQCIDSYFFSDKDEDKRWDDGEEGKAWSCQ